MKNKHSNKRIQKLLKLNNTFSKSKTKQAKNESETDKKSSIKVTFVRG